MKKLKFLFGLLLIVGIVISCDKDLKEKNQFGLKNDFNVTAVEEKVPSTPMSDEGVTPYVIPGENRGGNRTCEEVATAWDLDPNPFMCGEKIDYYDDGSFPTKFPEGLIVETDGKFISFEMLSCLRIGDKHYKVGAVIVKGSNAANVYYYPDGTLYDSGLASPINASGEPAGLSNLTFCFVECEKEPILLAVKCYYNAGQTELYAPYALSSGTAYPFSTINNWCKELGINYYPNVSAFDIIGHYDDKTVGTVAIEEGVSCLIVTVTLSNNLTPVAEKTYLYAGSLNSLTGGVESPVQCPAYTSWLKPTSVEANTATFIVPY